MRPTEPLQNRVSGEDKTQGRQAAFRFSAEPVVYPNALEQMEAHVAALAAGEAQEQLWFLEHPPLYTSGTLAKPEDLLNSGAFPVYEAGRGGEFTYHGPGQRVVYVMVDLSRRGRDVRAFVQSLEGWIIRSLDELGVAAGVRDGRIGVWVETPDGREAKIAAIGIRVRKWVSFHGISLNVSPNLEHFAGIVPCGIRDFGVTSLADLGLAVTMEDVDAALMKHAPEYLNL
ncbi:lipoyl(octanoyl) transferase LipB [Alphaproteobacteria bacterium]|nr:lipoyl(octanoyl) transferase LipB [Alphaproteobacteria bacterium]